MDSARLATLLDEVAVLVRRAGAAIEEVRGGPLDTEEKADGSSSHPCRPLRYVLAAGLRHPGFLVCGPGGTRDVRLGAFGAAGR